MKKVVIDYFGDWKYGRLGRTRFFALSVLASVAGIVLSLAVTVAFVAIGILPNEIVQPQSPETLAQLVHLTAAGQGLSPTEVQYVTTNRIDAPWWLAGPILHLVFANISMKRLRDIGMPGGWSYMGTHAIVAPLHFLLGATGLASLLLVLFSAFLLFTPTDGLR